MKYLFAALLLFSTGVNAQVAPTRQIETSPDSCACKIKYYYGEACDTASGPESFKDYVRSCASNSSARIVKKAYVIPTNGEVKYVIISYVVDDPSKCDKGLFSDKCND